MMIPKETLDMTIAEYESRLKEAKEGWYLANGTADLALKHRDLAEQENNKLRRLLFLFHQGTEMSEDGWGELLEQTRFVLFEEDFKEK
jgi:hypothetical protein